MNFTQLLSLDLVLPNSHHFAFPHAALGQNDTGLIRRGRQLEGVLLLPEVGRCSENGKGRNRRDVPRDLLEVPPHVTRTQVQSDVLQKSDSVDNDEENMIIRRAHYVHKQLNTNESPGRICTDLIAHFALWDGKGMT